jgi:acyl-CoA synthetase (AMP-forming)/AMP-acid ligase II
MFRWPGAPANFGVGTWIERRARIAPDHVALVHGDRSLTYEDLARRIRCLANGLRRHGVAPGDRVAWLGPNHPAFLESLFASGLLGAAMAPVNHQLETPEIRSVMQDADPRLVIQHFATDPASLPSSIRHRVAVAGPMVGALDYEVLLAGSPDDPIESSVGMDDICLLPHTSGTTGSPKGVMLTHANVTWNVVNFLASGEFRGDDVTIAIAPFFRVGGTGVNVLPVLFMGGTVVVPGDTSADEVLRLIERHRVSVGFGNPDSLDALTRSELWAQVDLSSIRSIITGGAPVPERLIRMYLDRGVTLLQGYGLSESGPLALLVDPGSALSKIGSAGRPPLLVDARVVSPNGAPVGPGETGELLVRGPNVMAGYWHRPEATREVLPSDGWLRTGDAARSDDDGYIWIVGRAADRFESAGQIVYPGDIERVLGEHPAIAEAGVTQTDAKSGEEVLIAFVVLSAGANAREQEVLAFARERLAPHQTPAFVTFVDRLPRNSVGKLIRAELRTFAAPQGS